MPRRFPQRVELWRASIRAEVVLAVGPTIAPRLQWCETRIPALCSLEPLRPLIIRTLNGLSRDGVTIGERLILDISAPTPLERQDGHWEQALTLLPRREASESSVAGMAALFERYVRPSFQGERTRRKAWYGWRAVICWAVARDCLHSVLPMTRETLHAFLWELLRLECSHSIIKGTVNAIQSRHRFFRLTSPITPASSGDYAALMSSMTRFQGMQPSIKYPIHKSLVKRLLRVTTDSLAVWRNCLAGAFCTLCCLRPCEGAAIQSCDLWFEEDFAAGYVEYAGCLTVNVSKRKNDQGRRGHHPRLGRASDPSLDIVYKLQSYLEIAQLQPRIECTKRARPSARCPACPPLFPLSAAGKGNTTVLTGTRPSVSSFSRMITRGLEAVGISAGHFSGACARTGGISTAIEAGVPEVILWMQSGHSQSRSARSYITLNSPKLLYDTWGAFQL